MRALLGLAAAMSATALCAAATSPLTERDVIAAFKARDWAKLKAISSSAEVYVRPDGGAPDPVGWISRDQFFNRLHACLVDRAFERDEYHPKAGLEMLCPSEPISGKPCAIIAYGINFAIIGNKVAFDTVYRFSDSDRINCPFRKAPPPPSPPRR